MSNDLIDKFYTIIHCKYNSMIVIHCKYNSVLVNTTIWIPIRYSNGGLNTGLNIVWYSNGIQIPDNWAIGKLLTIWINQGKLNFLSLGTAKLFSSMINPYPSSSCVSVSNISKCKSWVVAWYDWRDAVVTFDRVALSSLDWVTCIKISSSSMMELELKFSLSSSLVGTSSEVAPNPCQTWNRESDI